MNEDVFKELMNLGRLKQPFSDFEERVMLRIERERRVKAAAERYRKISWLFFILGAALGAVTTGFIPLLPGLNRENWELGGRLIYVILLLMALNYLLSGSRWRQLKSSL